jgi:hypothetical protein
MLSTGWLEGLIDLIHGSALQRANRISADHELETPLSDLASDITVLYFHGNKDLLHSRIKDIFEI